MLNSSIVFTNEESWRVYSLRRKEEKEPPFLLLTVAEYSPFETTTVSGATAGGDGLLLGVFSDILRGGATSGELVVGR